MVILILAISISTDHYKVDMYQVSLGTDRPYHLRAKIQRSFWILSEFGENSMKIRWNLGSLTYENRGGLTHLGKFMNSCEFTRLFLPLDVGGEGRPQEWLINQTRFSFREQLATQWQTLHFGPSHTPRRASELAGALISWGPEFRIWIKPTFWWGYGTCEHNAVTI